MTALVRRMRGWIARRNSLTLSLRTVFDIVRTLFGFALPHLRGHNMVMLGCSQSRLGDLNIVLRPFALATRLDNNTWELGYMIQYNFITTRVNQCNRHERGLGNIGLGG